MSRIVLHALLTPLLATAVWAQVTYAVPNPVVALLLPVLGGALALLTILSATNAFAARPASAGPVVRRLAASAVLLVLLSAAAAFVAAPELAALLRVRFLAVAIVQGALLTIVVAGAAVAAVMPRWLRWPLAWAERGLFATFGLFLLVSGLVVLNGAVDAGRRSAVATEVRAVHATEFTAFGATWRYTYVDLASWRRPGAVERLVLLGERITERWQGQPLMVVVRPGAFHVQWVSDVVRDRERDDLRVLQAAPTASVPLRDLIDVYLDRQRWQDATASALRYLELHPEGWDYVFDAGRKLGASRREAEALVVLEAVARQHPTADTLSLTGYALTLRGERERGIAMLREAVRLGPDEWTVYYRLAPAYATIGRPDDALAMYEKTLALRPNFPEVELQIRQLRRQIAGRRTRS